MEKSLLKGERYAEGNIRISWQFPDCFGIC